MPTSKTPCPVAVGVKLPPEGPAIEYAENQRYAIGDPPFVIELFGSNPLPLQPCEQLVLFGEDESSVPVNVPEGEPEVKVNVPLSYVVPGFAAWPL